MVKITAEQLMGAFQRANAEKPPAEPGGWIADDILNDAVLDGHFDFERITELLNELTA